MLYFDTDVWIHTLINQDEQKAKQSTEVLKRYTQSGYVISNLNIQEILFVLAKLKVDSFEIDQIAQKLLSLSLVGYSLKEINRARFLAKQIGFRQINDCIHTAIAETYGTELFTYNK